MPSFRINEEKPSIASLKANYDAQLDNYCDPAKVVTLEFIADEITLIKKIAEDSKIPYADKVFLEKYKLKLLKSLLDIVNTDYKLTDVSPIPERKEKKNSPPFFRYYFYLFSGLVVNLLHGFLGSRALLTLIPNIADPTLLVTNLVMTVLNGFSYYLYEGYVLKKNLNIPIMDFSTRTYLSLFEDQLDLTAKLNEKILSYSFTSKQTYEKYAPLAAVAGKMNEAIAMNSNLFKKYVETGKSYVFRQSIIVFGGIMAAGSAYFTINAAMKVFATALLGTLPGGLLCLGFVGLAIGFYIGQRTHKVYKMVNPQAFKFQEIFEKFEEFKLKTRDSDYYSKICRDKKVDVRMAGIASTRQSRTSDNSINSAPLHWPESSQTHRLFPQRRPAPLSSTVTSTNDTSHTHTPTRTG